MNAIHFTTVVGPDGVIRPPEGVKLPEGEIDVKIEVRSHDEPRKPRPGPGLFKGVITYMAPDFDAPLEDLKEYME